MKHTRTWRRVAALALALATSVTLAPVAGADEPEPSFDRVFSSLEPGAPAPAAEVPTGGLPLAASVAVTKLPGAVWDYFRAVNVTRIAAGVNPVIQNSTLGATAAAWAQQQAAQGTYALNPSLTLPASATGGYQAIYAGYASSADEAIAMVSEQFMWQDATTAADTDLGIAIYQTPGSGGLNRYTIYQIGATMPHSTPQAGEMTLYRFYRPDTGTHFYSTSAAERNSVIGNAAFRYEGQVAYVLQPSVTTAGTRALNRFYQPGSGTHFYTSTPSEYDRVLGFPQYSLDGVAGKVYTTAGSGRVPMYRFFRPASGTHFYTASASEMESVKGMPGYTFEGIAFYLRRAS